MMRTIQYSFPSKADGLEISCLAVVPELGRDEKYKGIIQIVHGMSEYKERYLPFMEYMAERKYVSVIHDHRGHGKSVRSKEDLGYMYGGGADAMLEEITERKGAVFAFLRKNGYECYESQAAAWYFSNINDPVTYQKIVK